MKLFLFVGIPLLMLSPVQAYACTGGGDFLDYLGINSYILGVVFSVLLAFKGLSYGVILKEKVFLRILKSGIPPFFAGILLSSIYGAFHGKVSGIDIVIVQSVFICVMTIFIFILMYISDRKIFPALKLKSLRAYLPINVLAAALFSICMTGELQCSSSPTPLSKMNASSIQVDSVSVFE